MIGGFAWADDFSTSGLPIDGPPTLAGLDRTGGNIDVVADIDPSTGAAHTSIAFAMSSARGAAQPNIALVYKSTLGAGIAGPGWTLSLPSVVRKGATGFPKFVDDPAGQDIHSRCANDVLLSQVGQLSCADRYEIGGSPQVPICVVDARGRCDRAGPNERFPTELSGWTYFRSEIDDDNRAFWSPDRQTWIVQTKAGITSIFGRPMDLLATGHGVEHIDALFRKQLPGSPDGTGLPTDVSDVYRWNLIRQFDASGNGIAFRWDTLAADRTGNVEGLQFLTDVYHTAPGTFGPPPLGAAAVPVRDIGEFAHHMHLIYSPPDIRALNMTQSPIWRAPPPLRLIGVDVTSKTFRGDGPRELVRRYHLDYTFNAAHTLAFLTAIQLEGRCQAPIPEDATGVLPATQCDRLPPTTFQYTPDEVLARPQVVNSPYAFTRPDGPVAIKDVDGDGLVDLLYLEGFNITVVPRGGNGARLSTSRVNQPGTGLTAGTPDIAPGAPHVVYGDFLHNGQVNAIYVRPRDVNQDPQLEIYSLDPKTEKWMGVRPFPPPPFFPATDWKPSGDVFEGAGRLIAVDVDGDGLTDLLLKSAFVPPQGGKVDVLQPYLSALGADGSVQPFAERGGMGCIPHHTPAGPQIRLMADFDADGLLDLVELERTDPGPATFPEWTARAWKGRGDGRFGIGLNVPDPCGQNAGFEQISVIHPPDSIVGAIADKTVAMHDVDGDGFADIVAASQDGIVLLRHTRGDVQGEGFVVVAQVPASDMQVCMPVDHSSPPPHKYDPSRLALLFADVDARGVDDLVVLTGFGGNCIIRFMPGRPGLLSRITNGVGGETTIEYSSVAEQANVAKASNVPWKRPLPIAAQVVKTITTANNLSGTFAQSRKVEYFYTNPVWDKRERLFAGFEQVTVLVRGQSDAPGHSTRTTFMTRACPDDGRHLPCDAADYAYRATRGLPAVVESLDQDGKVHHQTVVNAFTRTVLYSGMDGRVVRSVRPESTFIVVWDPEQQVPIIKGADLMRDESAEPGTTPPPFGTIEFEIPSPSDPAKTLRQSFEYDSFRNVQKVVNWGEVDQAGLPVAQPIVTTLAWSIASSEAEPDKTGWIWRPTSYMLGYGDSGGKPATTSRNLQYAWSGRGLLRRVDATLSGTQALFRHDAGGGVAPIPPDASVDGQVNLVNFFYDKTAGNLVEIDASNDRCSSIFYDPAFNHLPIIRIRRPSGCSRGIALESSQQFDRGLAAVTRSAGADSRISLAKYDGFGRLVELDQPDALKLGEASPFPALIIDWSQASTGPIPKVHMRRITGSGPQPSYAESWTYLDSLGTILATLSQGDSADSWIANGIVQRAINGLTLRAFEPKVFSGPDGSAFNIDQPSGRFASYSYDAMGRMLSSTTMDNATTVYTPRPAQFSDEVRDAEQLSPGGPHSGGFTRFRRDAFDRIVEVIQHFEKDPAERDTTTSMSYEASGELSSVFRDSASTFGGFFMQHFYDTLGRRVRTREPNTSAFVDIGGKQVNQSAIYAYNDNSDLVGTSDARGCGINYLYDKIGRLVAEDYSPCDSLHPPYSPPNLDTGEGVERLHVYDVPASPTGTSADAVYAGHLTATFDLAQKSDVVLDARGRVTLLRRQMRSVSAKAPSAPFASRYAAHVFQLQVLAYDEAGRVLTKTTGAESPELRPPGVGSWITSGYTPRGLVQSVTSSYGGLISAQEHDAYGALRSRMFGDAARTAMTIDYTDGRTVQRFKITRPSGPWLSPSPMYSPPGSSEPNTLQGVLTDVTFGYDLVRNPTEASDASPAAQWPPGARPVARRIMKYDDAYRLRQVDSFYAADTPGSSDDIAVSPFAREESIGSIVFPGVDRATNRVRQETFAYDFMGNVISADDDAHLFDRSTGTSTPMPDRHNQVSSLAQANATANVTYDAAGNVARIEMTRNSPCDKRCPVRYDYVWDEVGRLVGSFRSDSIASGPPTDAVEVTYLYDGSGRRRGKTVVDRQRHSATLNLEVFDTLRLENVRTDPSTGDYIIDAGVERVRFYSPAGMLGVARVQAPDAPSGTGSRTRVFLTMPDALGSPSFVIDRETGELAERASWQTRGGTEADYRPERWGDYRHDLRHTGHDDDSEVGLVNFGARYYAPMLGRWLSADPLTVHAMAGDANPYAFVRGSPLRFVDPIGLNDCAANDPNCQPTSEQFPDDPAASTGPAAGSQASGGGTATPPRGPQPSRPPPPTPGPPNVGVSITAFGSTGVTAGNVAALALGLPNVQLNAGGYHIDTTRFRIGAVNAATEMLVDDVLFPDVARGVWGSSIPGSMKEAVHIDAGDDEGDLSGIASKIAVQAGAALLQQHIESLQLDPYYVYPQGHHIFPQQFKEWFEKNGLKIDEYIAYIPAEVHEQLHRAGKWNTHWELQIQKWERNGGASPEEILEFGRKLAEKYELRSLKSRTAPVPRMPGSGTAIH
jgi:RHS repeat-associated protein